MAQMTRKEFLKKSTVLGMAGALGLSGLGKKTAHAAVLDNTDHNDITKDVINTVNNDSEDSAFHSGQTAQELAEAVNELRESFSEALTTLKDTDIAKAVGADGETFPTVNEQLGTIKTHEETIFTASSVEDIPIEDGYYHGGTKVAIDRAGLLTDNNFKRGTYTLTTNGIYDPTFASTGDNENDPHDQVYGKVVVNVTKEAGIGQEIFNDGYREASWDILKKGTALEEDVLEGKIFSSAEPGVNARGTMPNIGKVTKTLDTETTSVSIEKGFHNGEGKISIVPENRTITPGAASKTIKPTAGKVINEVTVSAVTASDGGIGQTLYNNGHSAGYSSGHSAGYSSGKSAQRTSMINQGYIVPSGTKNITSNGTHDVGNYKSVNVQVSTDFTKLKIGTYTTDTYVSVSGRDISRFLIVPDAYEESSLSNYRGGASRDFARVKAIFTPGSIQSNGFITAPRTKAYLLCTNGSGENPEDLTMEKICKYSVYYIS